MTAPDARIAQLLAAGSPEGIEALYDSCGTLAYTLALRVLGDPGAAEDVVQDVFLRIWSGPAGYDPKAGSLRAWVCTVVRNRAIDRLRAERRRVHLDVPVDGAVDATSPLDVWAEVAAALARDELQRALGELPPEQRRTVELAYFAGLSQTEISRVTQAPLGTVKSRARLALNRLRDLLLGVEASWQA